MKCRFSSMLVYVTAIRLHTSVMFQKAKNAQNWRKFNAIKVTSSSSSSIIFKSHEIANACILISPENDSIVTSTFIYWEFMLLWFKSKASRTLMLCASIVDLFKFKCKNEVSTYYINIFFAYKRRCLVQNFTIYAVHWIFLPLSMPFSHIWNNKQINMLANQQSEPFFGSKSACKWDWSKWTLKFCADVKRICLRKLGRKLRFTRNHLLHHHHEYVARNCFTRTFSKRQIRFSQKKNGFSLSFCRELMLNCEWAQMWNTNRVEKNRNVIVGFRNRNVQIGIYMCVCL